MDNERAFQTEGSFLISFFTTPIEGCSNNEWETYKYRIGIPERCVDWCTKAKTNHDHKKWYGKDPFLPALHGIEQTAKCSNPNMQTDTV